MEQPENFSQIEQAFRDVFEEQFKNAVIELIKINYLYPSEELDYFLVMFVYRSDGKLDTMGTISFGASAFFTKKSGSAK